MNRLEIAENFANNIKSDYIDKIILYGSVARNEDNDDSDIDILVVSSYDEEIEPIISKEVFNAIRDYGELISANVMSKEHFEETKNYTFLKNVLEEGKILG